MKSCCMFLLLSMFVLSILHEIKAKNCEKICKMSGVHKIGGCSCKTILLDSTGKRSIFKSEKTPEYNCSELCRLSSVNRIGSCFCRPEMVQTKKSDSSSEYNDGNRDYIIKELLKDYFMQNEESEEK
ncbi:unnamed protein product [Larinioides sclopetarius]|uniref:Uncharacterized protein n=1 Tax=Larinioides sclopetarius TaxID=280406 RepID=A0AAV1ZCL0_9ARAC